MNIGKNDPSLDDTPKIISKRKIETAESSIKGKIVVAISNIAPREYDVKKKGKILSN